MSPHEKFEDLNKDYSTAYIVEVAQYMTLYYTGIGQRELRQFWSQVEDIANFNNI
jgi:hypothetical protein